MLISVKRNVKFSIYKGTPTDNRMEVFCAHYTPGPGITHQAPDWITQDPYFELLKQCGDLTVYGETPQMSVDLDVLQKRNAELEAELKALKGEPETPEEAKAPEAENDQEEGSQEISNETHADLEQGAPPTYPHTDPVE